MINEYLRITIGKKYSTFESATRASSTSTIKEEGFFRFSSVEIEMRIYGSSTCWRILCLSLP